MDTNSLITLLIIVIFLLIVFIIRKGYYKKTTKIITSSPEEIIKQMQEHNFPEEMIENFKNQDTPFSTCTTTSTIHKVTYVNGKKVSEEKNSVHSTTKPLTNCPNCGAKIKNKDKETCDYCHTILTNKNSI